MEFNYTASHQKLIETGVSQSSELGPLLFLMYMNDIPHVSNVFEFLLFADDIGIFSMVGSILNYGILTWGFAHGRLAKIQKRVIRIITPQYIYNAKPLFKTFLKLENKMKLNALKIYFKYTHETLPHFFSSFHLSTQGAHHSHNTHQ